MELLIAVVVGGFVVWLIMRRNQAPPTPAGAQPATPPARSGGPGFIGWLLIITAGIFGISYLANLSGPAQRSEASNWAAPASKAADPYDQTGCSASKRAVTAKLKSPGSAKWVSCSVTTAAGVQTVLLAVDSQNAYGGLIRSEWMTRVRDNNVESVAQMR